MTSPIKKYYAALQLGYTVFGVGESEAAAIEMARECVDEPNTLESEIVSEFNAMDGDLIVEECSKALHDAVNEQGGDVMFDKYEGLYRLNSEIEGETNMTQATEYASRYSDVSDLMTALDNDRIDSDQDWENEATTWTFDDDSRIIVSGLEVTAA